MRRSTAKGMLALAATYGVAQGFNSFKTDVARRNDGMTVLFADTMSRPGFGGTQQGGFGGGGGGFGGNNNNGGFGNNNNGGGFGSKGGSSFGNNAGPKPFGNGPGNGPGSGPSFGQQGGTGMNGPEVGLNQGGSSFGQQQQGGNSFPQQQSMGGQLAKPPSPSMNGPVSTSPPIWRAKFSRRLATKWSTKPPAT